MSSDATQSALSRAYELVEAGKFDEARAILDPILAANRNNADAWWVYAHAVTNAEDGHAALENVVRINPNYPGAAELLAQAREVVAPKPKITPLGSQTGTMPAAPTHLPEADFPEPGAEDTAFSTQQRRAAAPTSRGGLPLIPILAVIIIFILVALILLSQGIGKSNVTPTATLVAAVLETPTQSIAQAATAEVTALVLPTVSPLAVTEQVTAEASAEATAGNFAAIESALAQFPLAESGVGEVQTSLGNTLQVTVCTTAGRAMRTLLPQVMNALAKQSPSLGAGVQAISARLLDCSKNSPLVTVAVDLATAQSYAAGKLTDTAFAATWKPQ